jgi:hypothetical protein
MKKKQKIKAIRQLPFFCAHGGPGNGVKKWQFAPNCQNQPHYYQGMIDVLDYPI